jgi:ligand-binding sensor domain-containing protein
MRRLLFALLLCSCADGKSTLHVIADAESGSIEGVKELRVTVSDTTGRASNPVLIPVDAGRLPPERRFALRFPAEVRGTFTLRVDAMPATGTTPLTSTSTDVALAPSSEREVTVKLPPPGSGTPVKLAFVVQPASSAAGTAIKPAPQVALQTAAGTTATLASAMVTVAIANNPSNGTLAGTLTVAAVGGIATFPDLKIDANGTGYTLSASAPQLSAATSAPFDITPPVWVPSGSGIFGASVTSIVLDPKFTAAVYIGTRDSGVHKTIDGGVTWKAVNAGLPRAPIVGITLDPVTTANLWVLTDGNGVYRTTNGGMSWSAVNTGFPVGAVSRGAIAVDPAHPTYVLAGIGNRIFRTTDSGGSWTEFSTGIVTYGPGISSFAFDNFVGVVFATNYGSGLYKSTYDGTVWTPTGGTALTGTSKYLTSVHKDTGDSSTWHVVGESGSALYRSVDGTTFNPITTVLPTSGVTLAGGTQSRKPMYAAVSGGTNSGVYSSDDATTWNKNNGIAERTYGVAVDTNDAKIAYAGGLTGVFKTTNGFTWAYSSATLSGNPITAIAIDPKNPARLFAGVKNQGIYRSTDSGATWSPPPPATAIPATASINGIAIDESDSQLMWASTVNGPWKSTDGGTAWTPPVGTSSSFSVAASPVAGSAWSGATATAYRIAMGEAMWTQAGSGLPAANDVNALATHPSDGMIVYGGTTAAGVFRTLNGGALWSGVTTGLTSLKISALVIDRTTPTTLFAGTSDGGVFKTSDGTMWSAASTGLTSMSVTALAIARSQSSTLYVGTLENGVFQSRDGGATWTGRSAGLGSTGISALAVDPQNPLIVYAGTWDGGVFKSAP